MSLEIENKICQDASDKIVEFYTQGIFGFPCPDLPREKRYLVPRPLTGTYATKKVGSLGAKIVVNLPTYWLVDVELYIEWEDGYEERPAVHRILYGYVKERLIIAPLHRVPHVGWDVGEPVAGKGGYGG